MQKRTYNYVQTITQNIDKVKGYKTKEDCISAIPFSNNST